MYLQMPFHADYRIQPYPISVILSGEGYIAYGIGGKLKLTNEEENSKENFFGNPGATKFDAGIGVKIEMEYQSYGVHFGYDIGLVNMARKQTTASGGKIEASLRNRNLYIGLAYRF